MSAAHENHEPIPMDDPHDRLLDIALAELVGRSTPPDLSSRIMTANEAAITARPQPAPVTKRHRRFAWTALAVAATLLVGVTTLLWPAIHYSHDAPLELAKIEQHSLASQKPQSVEAPVAPAPQPATTPEIIAGTGTLVLSDGATDHKAVPANTDLDSLTDLSLSVEGQSQSGRGARAAAAPVSLSVAQPMDGPEGSVQLGVNRLGSEQLIAKSELNSSAPVARNNNTFVEADNPSPASSAPALAVAAQDGSRGELDLATRSTPSAKGTTSSLFKYKDQYGRIGPKGRPASDSLAINDNNARNDTLREINKPVVVHDEKEVSDDVLAQLKIDGMSRSSGDRYTHIVENPFIKAEGGAAVSTFSIDVDTASYSNVRQFLLEMNQLPPPDAVRIEELVNYFDYDYAGPKPAAPSSAEGSADEAPFAAHVEVASCPWNIEHRLARIAVKGREMDRAKRPQSNLVFLVDVSGSMNEPAKLPLVKYGLERLTKELGENDHIAIVVYAGTEGLALPSTSGSQQGTILAALRKLEAGGSTAGGAGIQLAYQIAEDNFIKGGTNRVILCTDGDFNVGISDTAELQRLVEKKAKETGVFISTLGFGRGNLNDAMMVAISDHGNGNYHYIDNRTEARRVLVEQMTGTLVTIAKDVKIQVEFNPAKVADYRLIGYEKRMLRTEDFNNDKKDAGEIGAGHTVTALYEIVPAGKKIDVAAVDELKYQKPAAPVEKADKDEKPTEFSGELLTLKMRYKAPDGDKSKKLEWPIKDDAKSFSDASDDFQFAASVAGFGLLLRDSQFKGNLTFAADLELGQGGLGRDEHGYRAEFLDMVRKAQKLKGE